MYESSRAVRFGVAALLLATLLESYQIPLVVTVTLARITIMVLILLLLPGIGRLRLDATASYLLLCIVAYDLLSFLYADALGYTSQAILVKVGAMLPFFLVSGTVSTAAGERHLLGVVLLLFALTVGYALFEFLGQTLGFPTALPLLSRYLSAEAEELLVTPEFRRIGSFFHDPNNFACYVAMLTPLAIAKALEAGRQSLRRSAVWVLLIAGSVASVLISLSRSGSLALATGVLVFILLYGKSRPLRAIALAGLVATMGYYTFTVFFRDAGHLFLLRLDPEERWFREHMISVRSGIDVFLQAPYIGIGYGNFAEHEPTISNPHNIYVSFLAEGGVLGLVFEGSFMVLMLVRLWKLHAGSLTATALFAGLCALLAFNFTYWFYYTPWVWCFYALCSIRNRVGSAT